MRLTTFYELADGLAPFALSGEYCEKHHAYDNSGILVDCAREIDCVLFSLDLSAAAVKRAREIGAQLIVTHHPAIYAPLSSLTQTGAGKHVLACAEAGISVLSAHLNLDCAAGGIDECLMRGLGGNSSQAVMHTLSAGGYGRVFEVKPLSMTAFVQRARETFSTRRTVSYGDRPVRRVASFCGAGMDEESICFAAEHGADTFVSSDGKHHLVLTAQDLGMNVLLLTHYAAETYGFREFYRSMTKKSGVRSEFFADEQFL